MSWSDKSTIRIHIEIYASHTCIISMKLSNYEGMLGSNYDKSQLIPFTFSTF